MNKKRAKVIGGIAFNALLCIFLAICVCSVFLTLFSKKDSDGAAEIFGYQMRIVTSDSMAKCEHTDVSDFEIKDIPVRSMVFVKVMPRDDAEADEWYRGLQVGDVLTFRYVYGTQVTITHRITSITEKDTGGFIIELAGDNVNSDEDRLHQTIDTSVPNSTNYVIGKVTGRAYVFGVVMSFLMQPAGIILCIILPCAIIALFEVYKIIRMFLDDKNKRQQAENEQKELEIDELRRRIAELETLTGSSEEQEDTEKESVETTNVSKGEEQ